MAKEKYGHNRATQKQEGWNVRESTVKPSSNDKERVDISPEAFDRLLGQKGIDVKVFRTLYCPKVKSVDGAEHEIDCTSCNGSGFIDVDPLKTQAFIQSQNLETLAHVEGFVQGATVALTFPTGIEMQYFTKIELLDQPDIYYQRILRKTGTKTDITKYKAVRVNVVIDYNQVRYYQDQDFEIDVNGNLKWGTTRFPADNIVYSVHYETCVQYRAVTAIHANRFTQVKVSGGNEHIKLPEQWMFVKEFLVKRVDQSGNETPAGPFDNHSIVT